MQVIYTIYYLSYIYIFILPGFNLFGGFNKESVSDKGRLPSSIINKINIE